MELPSGNLFLLGFLVLFAALPDPAAAIRFPDRIPESGRRQPNQPLRVAVFALGSFWRSEAVFGCHPGVFRTSVGYAGGSKTNPEYRNLGDHAECVQVEYDPKLIQFKQLLDVFWASHDPRQVFGQGPDVGNQYSHENDVYSWALLEEYRPDLHYYLSQEQADNLDYLIDKSHFSKVDENIAKVEKFNQSEHEIISCNPRPAYSISFSSRLKHRYMCGHAYIIKEEISIIFTNGTLEARLAAASKEREQTKSRSSIVTTQIQQLGTFYPAVTEHQKFELKHNPFLLQLTGNMPEEELLTSSLAAKLNGYAAELCPPGIQKKIDAKINEILKNGWPIFREV